MSVTYKLDNMVFNTEEELISYIESQDFLHFAKHALANPRKAEMYPCDKDVFIISILDESNNVFMHLKYRGVKHYGWEERYTTNRHPNGEYDDTTPVQKSHFETFEKLKPIIENALSKLNIKVSKNILFRDDIGEDELPF